MPESGPQITTMELAEVSSCFASLVQAVSRQEARIIIAEAGVPIAALVAADDFERLTRLERDRAEGFRAIEAISLAFADVPLEELEAELSRIAAEEPQIDEDEPRRKLA